MKNKILNFGFMFCIVDYCAENLDIKKTKALIKKRLRKI